MDAHGGKLRQKEGQRPAPRARGEQVAENAREDDGGRAGYAPARSVVPGLAPAAGQRGPEPEAHAGEGGEGAGERGSCGHEMFIDGAVKRAAKERADCDHLRQLVLPMDHFTDSSSSV